MKPVQLKINLFQEFRDYLMITFGLVCYAAGFTVFQLPYHITTGGAAGLGAVIFYATGFPSQYTYLLVNVGLLVAAIKVLGIKFCIKTIYAVLMLTFLLGVAQELVQYMGTGGLYELSDPEGFPMIVGDQAFMACVIGAMLEGLGIGIVLLNNGSTGGTDIIASIVNKYRDVTIGQIMMLCDIVIISSSFFLPSGSWERLIYGYATLIIMSTVLDYVLDRARQSVQFLIISRRYSDIAEAITATGRGVTVLDGQGWYTKNEQKVLVVLARKSQSSNLFRIIKAIDDNAFISQSKVIGVFGQGFDKIKVK